MNLDFWLMYLKFRIIYNILYKYTKFPVDQVFGQKFLYQLSFKWCNCKKWNLVDDLNG